MKNRRIIPLFCALAALLSAGEPLVFTAGEDWTPLNLELEIEPGSALDFSSQGWHDAPAGKHGRVIARGPHFEFEKLPGEKQRFYGVNLSFGANVPSPEIAGQVAERLMRLGYNAVRIHHHENEFIHGGGGTHALLLRQLRTPENRDKDLDWGGGNSTTLNAESMARFDAFAAELIKRGIYLTTDLFTSRIVPWREIGEDRPGNIHVRDFKALVYVHEGARENLKKFARNFLSHVNPHTGRSYAREPALAWIVIVNEGNFFNRADRLQHPAWREAWKKWITSKRNTDPAFEGIPDSLPGLDLMTGGKPLAALQIFLAEIEAEFMRDWTKFLREELKCQALLSNQNGWMNQVTDHAVRAENYDYVDDHFYVYLPRYPSGREGIPFVLHNDNRLADDNLVGTNSHPAFVRLIDKPFTISEWNYCSPGKHRGMAGLITGSLAAQQDWDALWRYSYSHKKEMEKPFRPAQFDIITDTLAQSAERAVMTLFMRGDLEPHTQTTVLNHTRAELSKPRAKPFPGPEPQGWRDILSKTKVGARIDGTLSGDNETTVSLDDTISGAKPAFPELRQAAVRLNHPAPGQMTVATPRTAGGFTENGALQAGPLRFDIGNIPATVWVSSLDKLPISQSKRLLLTHLTDLQNDGVKYSDRSRTTVLEWGKLPHIIRNGKALISLKLDAPGRCTVHALATNGRRLRQVAATATDGTLSFTADTAHPQGAVMLYEIVRE